MKHLLNLGPQNLDYLKKNVFPKIVSGNTILILGAGASVTDKSFLSSQLMSFYEAKTGFSYKTNDIVSYVDVLSKHADYDRRDFDLYVDQLLRKLTVSKTHKIIASSPWREIITTNYDLLVEKAFDEIHSTPDELLKIKRVRKASDYYHYTSNDEVKYVKLNGCISDRNKYPLIFSSQDFNNSNQFYNTVLKSLESVSDGIQILAVGYSFSDPFGKYLLERFEKYNLMGRRWIISVDPYVQDDLLPYFNEQKVQIVKTSSENFFEAYKNFSQSSNLNYIKSNRFSLATRSNEQIFIHKKAALRLSDNIVQLSDSNNYREITPEDYYRGLEPTYGVVKKNLDVVHSSKLEIALAKIRKLINNPESEDVLPLVLLQGGFGSGKSTFGYRLIKKIYSENEGALAFEISHPEKIRLSDLVELIKSIPEENDIFFVFNNVEIDSTFNSIIELQVGISAEQIPDKNVCFVIPIRKNIYQKYKLKRSYSNANELYVDAPFNIDEAKELIDKLSECNLLNIRDVNERNRLAKKIVSEYAGDSFVSLMSIVTNNNFHRTVEDAFQQLSEPVQKSFLYTSLLYRFKIKMPASLLNRLTVNDWSKFTKDILEYDSEGILIKEIEASRGTEPDLFLRTRHSVISELLVNSKLKSRDKKFKEYLYIVRRLDFTPFNSRLLINLIKSIRLSDDLIDKQIDKLYDECANEFSEDPHFTLHYATNLEKRFDKDDKEKNITTAIDKIIYVQSLLGRRNHYLIHRRAVLNFALARHYNQKKRKIHLVSSHIDEARELFELKLLLDPFSSFSFVNYLSFEIWNLKNLDAEEEKPLRHVKIQELLDKAHNQLDENNLDKIASLEAEYYSFFEINKEEYISRLLENPETHHYGLILKYYLIKDSDSHESIIKIIEELEKHTHFEIVNKILFRFYGRTLYIADHRVRLFKLAREHKELLENDKVRYYFYLAVAEAYNKNFIDCKNHIDYIKQNFKPNPFLQETWKDPYGDIELFTGRLIQNKRHYRVKILEIQKTFSLRRANYDARNIKLTNEKEYKVKLNFYTGGLNAEIVE